MEITVLVEVVLLDTSVWIDYFRKKEPAFSLVDRLIEEERIGISRLVIAELLQGGKGLKRD